jgi:hypothetical protein
MKGRSSALPRPPEARDNALLSLSDCRKNTLRDGTLKKSSACRERKSSASYAGREPSMGGAMLADRPRSYGHTGRLRASAPIAKTPVPLLTH